MAPTALLATVTACLMIMFRESLDVNNESSCYYDKTDNFDPNFPTIDFVGFGEAFSLIMFAYAGAASFPTYQSDMKDSRDFPKAVLGAMISKNILSDLHMNILLFPSSDSDIPSNGCYWVF